MAGAPCPRCYVLEISALATQRQRTKANGTTTPMVAAAGSGMAVNKKALGSKKRGVEEKGTSLINKE